MVDTYQIGRFISAFSDEELESRRLAAQQYMKEKDLDAIILYGSEFRAGGVVRYYIDFPADFCKYGSHIILPREGGIAFFAHGPFQNNAFPYGARGIDLNFGAPYTPNWPAVKNFFAPPAAAWLNLRGYKKLGIYHQNMVPFYFMDYILRKVEGSTLTNVDDDLDLIRSRKSETEITLLKHSVGLHDQLMAAVPEFLKPGRLERDVAADIKKLSWDIGSDQWTINIGSDAKKADNLFFELQNREIQAGDTVNVFIQISGPGSYWGTLSRMFVVGGEPSEALVKATEDSVKIQTELAAMAKPGVQPVELRKALLKFQEENGYKTGSVFFAHAQGTDPIERPAAEEGETLTFEENNVLAIYPVLENDETLAQSGDNFIVTKDGAVRMNKTAQGVMRV